jgi:hypothetical protein
MLQLVNVGQKSLSDYATLLGRRLTAEIQRLADAVEGKRVLHLSATAFGGGVAEINYTLVLMRSGGSSRARTSSSTSRRRSTTPSRALRRAWRPKRSRSFSATTH